jgi:hypothetical protein
MYQQMALQFANQISPELGQQVANQILSQGGQPVPQDMGMEATEVSEGGGGEHPFVEKARKGARESTQAD